MRLRRDFVIVPCNVSAKEQKYILAYQIESRNGKMIKSFGKPFEPFNMEKMEEARKQVHLPKIVDLRI